MKRIGNISVSILLVIFMLFGMSAQVAAKEVQMTVYAEYFKDDDLLAGIKADSILVHGSSLPGRLVFMRVLKPEFDGEITDLNISDALFYADDCVADENGEYSFTFGFFKGTTGEYKIRVSCEDVMSFAQTSITVINEDDRDKTIARINAAGREEIKGIFENEYAARNLSFDDSAYDRLKSDETADYKKAVHDKLYDAKAVTPITTDNLKDYRNLFESYSALSLYNQLQSADVLMMYKASLGLTEDDESISYAYSLIKSETDRLQIFKSLEGKTFDTPQELQKKYHTNIVLCAVGCSAWQSFDSIIKGNKGLLGTKLLFDKYDGLTNKSQVALALSGKVFKDADSFISAFNIATQEEYAKENNKDSSPSGGASKKSSGSSMGASVGASQELEPIEYTDPESGMFSDLSTAHWGYNSVNALVDKEIISGYDDNTFKPDKAVTRAEYTKLIMAARESLKTVAKELANLYKKEIKSVSFDDVSENDWFAPYVKDAAGLGIINGRGTIFAPDENITREDAAVILYRFLDEKANSSVQCSFADKDDIAAYALDAVSCLTASGVVSGMGDNTFLPKSELTRAQAAQLIYNAISGLALKEGK